MATRIANSSQSSTMLLCYESLAATIRRSGATGNAIPLDEVGASDPKERCRIDQYVAILNAG